MSSAGEAEMSIQCTTARLADQAQYAVAPQKRQAQHCKSFLIASVGHTFASPRAGALIQIDQLHFALEKRLKRASKECASAFHQMANLTSLCQLLVQHK